MNAPNLPATQAAATPAATTTVANPLMDPVMFEHMARVGKMMAVSPLFPDHLRKGNKESAIANGVLVMNMALRLNEDPLTVAQNIYFVSGKPGWSASYMIAKANQFGVFKDPIDWRITGAGDELAVTAQAELAATGKKVHATCTMAMAKREGWTKNSKYQSMPEQMLRYRSATFLIRLYCPQVMVGVPSQIEIETGGATDLTPMDVFDGQAVLADEVPVDQDDDSLDREALERMADDIKADLTDAPDAEDIFAFYTEQMATLTEQAPDLVESLKKHAADAAALNQPTPEPESENPAPADNTPEPRLWVTVAVDGDEAQYDVPAAAAADLVSLINATTSSDELKRLQDNNAALVKSFSDAGLTVQAADVMNAAAAKRKAFQQP